jgi:type I restriction enzyme, S subunit
LSNIEGIVSPAYTIATPKKNADAVFFSYLFKLPEVVHRFYRHSQGLVDDTLNCKFPDFAAVRVMVPSNKIEQVAIGKVLVSADEEIKILVRRIEKLKEQRKGIMQLLLTGRKRLI